MGFIFYFILIMLVPLIVQVYLRNTYSKYLKVATSSGFSGAMAARRILDANGLYDVTVEQVSGHLSDHYDPRTRSVRLSTANYHGTSIASISVAVHEVGHCLQQKEGYVPLRIRHALVPVANIGSNISFILILIGLLLSSANLLLLGIAAMAAAVLFQVITLPVEFNASSRALNMMIGSGLIRNDEEGKARKVLNAAALTYVAATVVAIAELLRFVLMFTGMRNNED
ncbi:zinc metallopeptidase [Neobacillus sp. MM2021_6]|uniref:zinc metallopeptidase n=1 Tax=Bacillaceae TaxID=186817 RepID=UPI00140C05C3|nr:MULTISPECIES: zinc metallopeptidase [Bacillaceae]MBO0961706.1 zinc metallopeptidase [Neobacillus sp. MM2021_6]NHC18297.1 zinc metallopeptidase [Bacillus sp. MM2020_4]WML39985.1 zinc metallopeptidase [Neobacillus sp. OS1-2]